MNDYYNTVYVIWGWLLDIHALVMSSGRPDLQAFTNTH